MKKFITVFVVKINFLVFLFHNLASANYSCWLAFLLEGASSNNGSPVEFVDISTLRMNDSVTIRNRLDITQNTGAVTLVTEQALNPEIAMKLHNFLIMHSEINLNGVTVPLDLRADWKDISSKVDWKNQLSKGFSKVEINQIERELERYFNQIAKTILSVDDKAIEVLSVIIRTEKHWSPKMHDHGYTFRTPHTWISATHTIFGPGT